MDDYNRQASEYIFRANNSTGRVETDCIDLHGLYVQEAEDMLEKRIRADQAAGQTHLHAIVGQGHHSAGHVQKIKPKVEELCRELGLKYRTEENAGRIYINLQGGEPLGPSDQPAYGHHQGGNQYPQHGGGQHGHYGGQQQQHHGGQPQHGGQHHQQQHNQQQDNMEEVVKKNLPWILKKLEKNCCVVM